MHRQVRNLVAGAGVRRAALASSESFQVLMAGASSRQIRMSESVRSGDWVPGGIHAREPTGRELYWISNMEVREGNLSRSFTGLLFEGDDPRVIAAAMCKEHRIGRCGYVESQLVAAEQRSHCLTIV